jgi:outer membrane protein
MKSRSFNALVGLSSLLLTLHPAWAQSTGIAKLHAEAQVVDAQFASARSSLDAAKTLPGQAMGQLLPQLSISGSRIKNETENTLTTTNAVRNYDFVAKNASLNLSLALLRPQLWMGYAQSKAQLRQAEAQFAFAEHDLLIRVAQAYFDTLLAVDNLKFVGEQKSAITQQLTQSKRYFDAGVGTITDVNESQARYDTILAQEIAAENQLEIRIRALEQIVGGVHRNLARLGERFVLENPDPDEIERWIEVAMENNPQVRAALYSLEAAESEVRRNFSAHLPTVDLVAARSLQKDPGYTTLNQRLEADTVGIQVSIPLFSGGTTQGRVNQSAALREKARSDFEEARRAITLQTRQHFLNVRSGIARVKALEQAVKSNELALYSARKGQEAGLRTSFDVLNAQQLLFSTKRDLAQARYDYVMSRLKLRGAAGLLNESDIHLVQSWLEL